MPSARFAAEGIRFVVADLPADMLLAVADAAAKERHPRLQCRRDRRRAAQEAVPGERHPRRAEPGDARRRARRSIWSWKKWTRWFLIVGSHAADQAYADGHQARGAALRRRDRRGARVQGYGRRAHHRFRPVPRCRRRWPSSRRRRPSTTSSWSRTRARCSAPTCPTTPGRRRRSPARTGLQPDELVAGARPVGRDPDPEPLRRRLSPADDGQGHRRRGRRCASSARRRRGRTAPIRPRWWSSSKGRASRWPRSRARS